MPIKKNNILHIHGDPRRLFVAIRNRHIRLEVTVLHAPHAWSDDESRQEWWRKSVGLVSTMCDPRVPRIYLFDANMDITEHLRLFDNGLIGDYGVVQPTDTNHVFSDVLSGISMMAPDLFRKSSRRYKWSPYVRSQERKAA